MDQDVLFALLIRLFQERAVSGQNSPADIDKALLEALDAQNKSIINNESPVDCSERRRCDKSSTSVIAALVVTFQCQGHENLPFCCNCTIKGPIQIRGSQTPAM